MKTHPTAKAVNEGGTELDAEDPETDHDEGPVKKKAPVAPEPSKLKAELAIEAANKNNCKQLSAQATGRRCLALIFLQRDKQAAAVIELGLVFSASRFKLLVPK